MNFYNLMDVFIPLPGNGGCVGGGYFLHTFLLDGSDTPQGVGAW